jgi:hypothetical protein
MYHLQGEELAHWWPPHWQITTTYIIISWIIKTLYDKLLQQTLPSSWSWGSSVCTVSDCRLDDQGLIPGRGKDFFL